MKRETEKRRRLFTLRLEFSDRNNFNMLISLAIFVLAQASFLEADPQFVMPQMMMMPQMQVPMIPNAGNADKMRDSCEAARIPCGGHTAASCLRYCTSVGFTAGSCDGSCCMCSNDHYTSSSTGTGRGQNARGDGSGASSLLTSVSNVNRAYLYQQQQPVLQWDPLTNQIFQQPQPPQQSYHGQRQHQFYGYGQKKQNESSAAASSPRRNFRVPQKTGKRDVCSSSMCHDQAYLVKSQMDEVMDPCDDFYTFACGGFNRKKQIARDQVEVTQFSLIRDKVAYQLKTIFEEGFSVREASPFKLVKTLYKSCMNTGLIQARSFQPLIKALEEVGGWPVLEGSRWSRRDEFRWENFAVWFKEIGFGMDYFMKISLEPDLRNVGKRYITIGEPILGLSDHVMKRGLNEPIVSSYYNFMVDMAVAMGADKPTAKREMLDAVNFEVGLSQCFYRPDNRQAAAFYNPMTINQLSAKYPQVPWLSLFRRLIPAPIRISGDEVIMVSVPQYLECFFNLLQRTEQKALANYAVWRVISGSAPFLHDKPRNLQQQFTSKITGQKDRKPRWKECVEIASQNMGNAVGAMYVRRYFRDSDKHEASQMVKNIRQAFLDILEEQTWMDSYTKMQAREKALQMLVHIGYPEEHKSDAKISAVYKDFRFDENDYFGNIRNLLIGGMKQNFGKLRTPIRRNDWLTHGRNAVVNAFYLPQENSIQFPAAILQEQFFNATRPKYLNYAAIGWIIGHEITHGFDDQGHQFDKQGNHNNWWAASTKNTYNRRKQCVVDLYNGFQHRASGLRLNGERGQGENIADLGGIKQAYRGYQYWLQRNGQVEEKALPGLEYSPQQMFWISAAQNWCSVQRPEYTKHSIVTGVHSPAEFRVRGTFMNNEDFARDWNCPVGGKMNPRNKCSVW